jgi:hypothetical protein
MFELTMEMVTEGRGVGKLLGQKIILGL